MYYMYIDELFNIERWNILDPGNDNYQSPSSNVFLKFDITEDDYNCALAISGDSHYYMYVKREANECCINNYLIESLKAWKLNLDIQPVINYYKTVTYIYV